MFEYDRFTERTMNAIQNISQKLNDDNQITRKDFLLGCSIIALSNYCQDTQVLKETAEKFVDELLK